LTASRRTRQPYKPSLSREHALKLSLSFKERRRNDADRFSKPGFARIRRPNNQLMVSAGLGILGLGAAWILSGYVSNSDYHALIYSALLVAVAAITVAMLRNWRAGFYVFLVWLLFEDLIRKYMGNDMRIYFAKDYLALITYVSIMVAISSGARSCSARAFCFSSACFSGSRFCRCFNPEIPSVWYGLLGLKLYFYYVPMMFVGYALIETEADLYRFLVINMLLAIAISGIWVLPNRSSV
jgi:hypothetical protein